MKKRILNNFIVSAMLAIAVSSCLKQEDPKVFTAEGERKERKEYLNELIAKGNKIDSTENGVYYYIRTKGEGFNAKPGDTLTVGYAGYFIDGYMFDTSETQPTGKMTFILKHDESRMIEGFEEAMTVLNKNAVGEFIIPSELAYGKNGMGIIPGYQTLIFVIKIYEIKPVIFND